MWWGTALGLLGLLGLGCRADLPEGRFLCVAASDCPAGWYCVAGHCHSTASDGAFLDSGTLDAPRDDAPLGDAPLGDAPVIDAPRPCMGPADCSDGNACTDDICLMNTCTYALEEDGASCDDDMFCNGEDTCESGRCAHAGDPCTAPTVCDDVNDWCSCDDGNPCTGPDHVSPTATCVGDPLGPATACGPPCDGASCMVCCAGTCRDMRQRDYCAGCVPCSSAESCVYAPARGCGWLWCCAT